VYLDVLGRDRYIRLGREGCVRIEGIRQESIDGDEAHREK
jgi:hypothetical protein